MSGPRKRARNPWQTIDVRPVYDNAWISVAEHRVIDPSGNPGIYGKVSFQNTAVGVIPVDEQGNTWLVGQYRYVLDEYSWEIPEGGVPLGTDILEGAKRELKEETGLTANRWQQILRLHISNSVTDEEGYVFLAEDLHEGETEFESTEELTIRRLPFSQVVEMVTNGEITDGMSIAGVLTLARLRDL